MKRLICFLCPVVVFLALLAPPAARAAQGQVADAPAVSPISFCVAVARDNRPLQPAVRFSPSAVVYAAFQLQNIPPAQLGSRGWERDGDLLSGSFDISAQVVESEDENQSPSFGPITFSERLSESQDPLFPSWEFDFGIQRVYASFVYAGMRPGQSWSKQWRLDGEVFDEGTYRWNGNAEGATYLLTSAGRKSLKPGEYSLSLFVDGRLSRSASFVVRTVQPREPARPEDIVDAELLTAWYKLRSCPTRSIQKVADLALEYHIPIRVGETEPGALAAYSYDCSTPPHAGQIVVARQHWNEAGWEELTATLAHELTHAVQHLSGQYSCGCTIDKEFLAFRVQLFVLRDLGRQDLLESYGELWTRKGGLDEARLWSAVQELYPECPEY